MHPSSCHWTGSAVSHIFIPELWCNDAMRGDLSIGQKRYSDSVGGNSDSSPGLSHLFIRPQNNSSRCSITSKPGTTVLAHGSSSFLSPVTLLVLVLLLIIPPPVEHTLRTLDIDSGTDFRKVDDATHDQRLELVWSRLGHDSTGLPDTVGPLALMMVKVWPEHCLRRTWCTSPTAH